MKKNLILMLFFPIIFGMFSCGAFQGKTFEKPKETEYKNLTLDYFNQSKFKTFYAQEKIHLVDGFDEIYIPKGRSCLLDTVMRSDTIIGRAYFGSKAEPDSDGKEMTLKTSGEPFLIFLLNEEKEFYLTDWAEHPDSTSYDSGVPVKGKQRFWKIEAGKDSKLGVDPTRRIYVLKGKADPNQPKKEEVKKPQKKK